MIELKGGALQTGPFLTFTTGIIVLIIGKRITDTVGFLREFSIPAPEISESYGVANTMEIPFFLVRF